jgi:hypothetical protein
MKPFGMLIQIGLGGESDFVPIAAFYTTPKWPIMLKEVLVSVFGSLKAAVK